MKLVLNDGAVYMLDKPQITIGRSPRNDFVFMDERVSGKHALISMDGDAVILSDVGSSNGTFVNNMRLSEPIRLMDGDEIRVGDTRLTVVDDTARQSDVVRTQLDFHPEPALPDTPAPSPTPPAMPAPPPPMPASPARPVTAAPPKPASRQWIVWAVVGVAAVCVLGIGVIVAAQAVQTGQANATGTAVVVQRANGTATAEAANRRATETTLATMLDDLAAICRGTRGGSEFDSYTGGSGVHPIALIAQEDRTFHEWDSQLPSDWRDDDWSRIQLAGCVSAEWETIETCDYSGFTKLFRDQQHLTLKLVSAQSGSVIDSNEFWGTTPEACLLTETFTTFNGITMNKTKQGDPVSYSVVKSWLAAYAAP